MSDEVVSSYSVDQALADGVLVRPMPDRHPHLLVTCGVWAKVEEVAIARGGEGRLERARVEVLGPLVLDLAVQIAKVKRRTWARWRRDTTGRVERPPQEGERWLFTQRELTKDFDHSAVGRVWVTEDVSSGIRTVMFPEEY